MRFPWAAFHSCLYTAYYTISGMSAAFSSHHRGKYDAICPQPFQPLSPSNQSQLLQLFSTHPCGFLRTARPFSVSRYFCRRDRGLSGIVYSSMPSESNISRTDFLNLVLSVLPSLRINSNAEQGIAQPAATRSKTVSTDLPPGLSALTWCPDLVPRLSPDCAPTGHACRVVYAAINARLSRRIGSDDTAPESPLRSAAHAAASIRTRPISDIACSQMASKG